MSPLSFKITSLIYSTAVFMLLFLIIASKLLNESIIINNLSVILGQRIARKPNLNSRLAKKKTSMNFIRCTFVKT